MKKYVVQWKSNEEPFEDIKEAINFAEQTGEKSGSSVYVWVENDGVRDEEPFFSCEWSL